MTKHRSFTPEFRAQVVLEVLTGARTAAEACREYQLTAQALNRWKAQFLEEAPRIFEDGAEGSQEGPAPGLAGARTVRAYRMGSPSLR